MMCYTLGLVLGVQKHVFVLQMSNTFTASERESVPFPIKAPQK